VLELAMADTSFKSGNTELQEDALTQLVKKYMASKKNIQRLSRLFASEVLLGMLFVPVQGVTDDSLEAKQAEQWMADVCIALNDRYSGTRNYSSELIENEDGWHVKVIRHVHGVDNPMFVSAKDFASVEFKSIISMNLVLQGLIEKEAIISRGEKEEVVYNFEDAVSWLMKEGQRGMNIQRYKGLGEMNPEQLWETTLDPEQRRLMQVRIEDAVGADEIFTTLMGDQVEPRREFIETNALSVENLDI